MMPVDIGIPSSEYFARKLRPHEFIFFVSVTNETNRPRGWTEGLPEPLHKHSRLREFECDICQNPERRRTDTARFWEDYWARYEKRAKTSAEKHDLELLKTKARRKNDKPEPMKLRKRKLRVINEQHPEGKEYSVGYGKDIEAIRKIIAGSEEKREALRQEIESSLNSARWTYYLFLYVSRGFSDVDALECHCQYGTPAFTRWWQDVTTTPDVRRLTLEHETLLFKARRAKEPQKLNYPQPCKTELVEKLWVDSRANPPGPMQSDVFINMPARWGSDLLTNQKLTAGIIVPKPSEIVWYQKDFTYTHAGTARQDIYFDGYVFPYLEKAKPAPGMVGIEDKQGRPESRGASSPRYSYRAMHAAFEVLMTAVIAGGKPRLAAPPNIYYDPPKGKCWHGVLRPDLYCSACCVYQPLEFGSRDPRTNKILAFSVCLRHGLACPQRLCKEHFTRHGSAMQYDQMAEDCKVERGLRTKQIPWRLAVDAKPAKFIEDEHYLVPLNNSVTPCPKCSYGHLASYNELVKAEKEADKSTFAPLVYPDLKPPGRLTVIDAALDGLTEVDPVALAEARQMERGWLRPTVFHKNTGSFSVINPQRTGLRKDREIPWAEVGFWLQRFYPEWNVEGSDDRASALRLGQRLYRYEIEKLTYADIASLEGLAANQRSAVSKDIQRFYERARKEHAAGVSPSPAMVEESEVYVCAVGD